MNIVVYWGDLPDVLTFVTSSVHPDLVTIVCGDGRTGARLAAELLRLQGCPVLLIPRGFPSAGARGLRNADWAALVN